jgi:hypothetical protein
MVFLGCEVASLDTMPNSLDASGGGVFRIMMLYWFKVVATARPRELRRLAALDRGCG